MDEHPRTEKIMGKGTIYLMIANLIFLISGYAIRGINE